MCENSSKLTVNIPERRHWRRSRVFIINFEQIFFSFYLGFLPQTFTICMTAGEGKWYLINSSLPLPPATQTL